MPFVPVPDITSVLSFVLPLLATSPWVGLTLSVTNEITGVPVGAEVSMVMFHALSVDEELALPNESVIAALKL